MTEATPNIIAYLMLGLWPLVVWQFYQRLGPARALIWTVLGAYLLLPERTGFDLPMMPELNKSTLPVLAAALITWRQLGLRLQLMPQSKLGRGLIAMFVVSPFVTVLTNGDALPFPAGLVIPGMRIYDSIAAVVTQSLYILPLWLARRDLARPEAMRDLLVALALAALIYAAPILLESRVSPQLHQLVYGFFQHDFSQAIRFGGFRPFVFMPHGLWVAFFAVACLVATSALLRIGPAERRPRQAGAFLLGVILVISCKSFGPMLYMLLAVPLIFLLKPRHMLLLCGVLAFLVVLYPLLRGAHLVPVDQILQLASDLSAERGDSLRFRLQNEEDLLLRASERPWFGWGGYGRNFMHDPYSGEMINIADGAWILRIGIFGWLGFLAEFGLLALPLLLGAREALDREAQIGPEAAALALILALNLVDLLPNATLVPLTWLISGALLGHVELLRQARHQRRAHPLRGPVALGQRTVI